MSPVYRTLDLRLTMFGVDRGVFWQVIMATVLFYLLFETIIGTLALFASMYSVGLILAKRDPMWLWFYWHASWQKSYVDPAK